MGQTAYIPSLKISTENWKEESKKAPLLRNDGAFFVRNNRLEGWLSETDLNGLRWMDEKTFDLLCGLLRMIALLFP
ncbi:hypothetical protein AAHB54_05780 [Bacillus cereus]